MKTRYLLTLLAILLFTFESRSQDELEEEASPLSISGSLDAYFRMNLNAKNTGEYYQAPGTAFGNLPGFSLGMFNLVTAYEGEKAGFVADLVFGPRGEDATFASPYYSEGRGSSQIINQLYAYWNVNDALTLTMGNFNTFLGYEVISPVANFNYTTSYMFSYGPFSHTGLKADYTVSDDLSLMVAIMNPTDMTEFNPFGTYTAGLQIGVYGSTFINFVYGDQDGRLDPDLPFNLDDASSGKTFQMDITSGFDLSDKLYLGANATYNTTSPGEYVSETGITAIDGDGAGFYGLAGYLQVTPSESFALGTRLEYFKVYNSGLDAGFGLDEKGNGSIINLTLTGLATVGNLSLIPELRIDTAGEESFINGNLESGNNLASFIFAAVYSF